MSRDCFRVARGMSQGSVSVFGRGRIVQHGIACDGELRGMGPRKDKSVFRQDLNYCGSTCDRYLDRRPGERAPPGGGGRRACASATSTQGEHSGVQVRCGGRATCYPRVWGWNGFLGVGFYLSPTPHTLWNGERGPWRRELAQAGPQPAQPGRRELISRLSPRLLPLPFSAPSSLFPSLLPGPAPTRPCQAPCPGGCQAPGGTRRDM